MSRRLTSPRWLLTRGPLILLALLVLIQAVPYGRSHANPPVTAEPAWDAQTRTLFMRACGDCHSNLTVWPWYSNVAPISWLVQRDVDGGRSSLNLSTTRTFDVGDVVEQIQGGSMPPWFYVIQHAQAGLSKADQAKLVAGLRAAAGR